MFLIAKLFPRLEEPEQKDYAGTLLSRADKETLVKRFYAEKLEIPLCIDHRDVSKLGFVKGGDRVGRVSDLFVNQEEELMMKCELFRRHGDGYREVNQGMFSKKERWGVSVGVVKAPNGARNLVHVALTNDPAFAKEGTYISHWGLNEEKVDAALCKMVMKRPPSPSGTKYGGFLSPELKTKLEDNLLRMDPQQQQQATTGEEAKMEVEGNTAAVTATGKENMSKRALLADLNEHLKTAGCGFLDMDFEFRENYITLERDIRKEDEENSRSKQELYDKLGLAKDCRAQIDSIISDNTPDAQPLRNMVSELMCCNTEFYKQSTAQIKQLTSEKASLADEVTRFKQAEQEKEAINASNKRARPAPYNFGNMVSKPVTPIATAAPQTKKEALPTIGGGRLVYSFLDTSKPSATKSLNNEMVKGLVDPRLTGYEKRNDYTTNSLSQYKMYQQFDMACNGSNPYQ